VRDPTQTTPASFDYLGPLAPHVARAPAVVRIPVDAFLSFLIGDGWAIASHIALSLLMALFPFMILVAALAEAVGFRSLGDEAARLLFESWPKQVAEPIVGDVQQVQTALQGSYLTFSVLLAIYFASSGIESLRIGLNRAYGVYETRGWWLLRLESIFYVLVSAIALLVMAVMVVLGPLIIAKAGPHVEWLSSDQFTTARRFSIATGVLVLALVLVHKWLPAGRRRLVDIVPGVLVTIMLWLVAGVTFGLYLAQYANRYVSMYSGLASAMIALVFLYFTASIFLYGGELNAAILRAHRRPERAKAG